MVDSFPANHKTKQKTSIDKRRKNRQNGEPANTKHGRMQVIDKRQKLCYRRDDWHNRKHKTAIDKRMEML